MRPSASAFTPARAKYMLDTQQGLTKTYNAFKNPDSEDPAILALRALHIDLDRAVLHAYGWHDIEVPPYTTPRTTDKRQSSEPAELLVLPRPGRPRGAEAGAHDAEGARRLHRLLHAINRALSSGDAANRTGRPANKNLITFVTLGSSLDDIAAFLEDHEMKASDEFAGAHLRTWLFRKSWASLLANADQEYVRAAALVESEFALRWIALDSRATWALCSDAAPETLANLLVASIHKAPSIADRGATKPAAQAADDAIESLTDTDTIELFMKHFRDGGQGRSQEYERVLTSRFGAYSRGMAVWGSLRPDVIFEEYRPCAVTKASDADPSVIEEAIKKAIRRECHVAEFTAHMQSDLRGLADYLRKKVLAYAELLESV